MYSWKVFRIYLRLNFLSTVGGSLDSSASMAMREGNIDRSKYTILIILITL